MFCANCGEENNSSSSFCKRCGSQLVKVMPENPYNDSMNGNPETPFNGAMNARQENNLMGFNPDANSSNDDILMYSRYFKEGRVHDKDDPATQQLRQEEAESIQQAEKTKTKDSIFLILSPYIFILAFYLLMILNNISGLLFLMVAFADFALFIYYTILHLVTVYHSAVNHYFRFRYIPVGLVFLVVRLFVPIDNIFSIPLFTLLLFVALILVTDWKNITINGNCQKRDVLKLISVYAFYFTVFECGMMFMLFG